MIFSEIIESMEKIQRATEAQKLTLTFSLGSPVISIERNNNFRKLVLTERFIQGHGDPASVIKNIIFTLNKNHSSKAFEKGFNMIIHRDIEQGTEAWFQLRKGHITGSMVHNLMSNGRGGKPSQMRNSYMMHLLAEILTDEPAEQFKTKEMEWGNQMEDAARSHYEFEEGEEVEQVAFIELSPFLGYSPDGLIGDEGLLEIKCPKTTTQLKRFFDEDEIPKEYYAQMQFGLWITNRKWCDFVSYDPRLNNKAEYLVTRVYRDEDYLLDMESRIQDFILDMKRKLIQANSKE